MEKKNELIYCLKGMAIISVVYAHCNNRVMYSDVDIFLDNVRGNIGTIGVPLFLVLSGYLFNNRKLFLDFWRKKMATIVPWLIWGTIVWAYEVSRKGLEYANLCEWLIGIGSYLWFMHAILAFWLLFFFVRSRKSVLLLLCLSIVYRIIIYDFGIVIPVSFGLIVNNILCHMPYFLFGMLLRQDIAELHFHDNLPLRLTGFGGTLICICLALFKNHNQLGYGSPFFLLYAFGSGVLCLEICRWLCAHNKNGIFSWLGRYSFLIYLIHMPAAGLISNIFSRNKYTLYLVLLYPLLALAISAVGVLVLNRLCKKSSILVFALGIGKD